ncbi:E3 RID-beta [Simian adenovirus A1296]|uniref:E3 RID-beta n=1 Tax=Simian adenovirus A1296 TaxID=1159191 RepID=H9AAQ9_9ADEN|nr:E3 RID-beta [Simian adenovirus A1296]
MRRLRLRQVGLPPPPSPVPKPGGGRLALPLVILLILWPSAAAAETTVAKHCHFQRLWDFPNCYHKKPEFPAAWLYVTTFFLIFISTVLGLFIFGRLRYGWLHATDELPTLPSAPSLLPPPPPPPPPPPVAAAVIQLIRLNSPPRRPSVISYFELS